MMLPADPPEPSTNTECIDDEVATTQRPVASELLFSNATTMPTTEAGQEAEEGHKRQREETAENLAVEDSGKPAKRPRSSSETIAKTLPAPDKSAPVVVTDDKPEIAASPTVPLFSRTDTKHGELAGVNSPSQKRLRNQKRWRVHQMAEDYVQLASNMMLAPTSHLGPFGYDDNSTIELQSNGDTSKQPPRKYPMELISSLGFLKSPLRRPTVIEKWSPYEISLFEAGMGHYGKEFFDISKLIQTKSTKEVIDFYYIWKKTSHYMVWKKSYIQPTEILSDEEHASNAIKKAAR